jgi:hypothetical protein
VRIEYYDWLISFVTAQFRWLYALFLAEDANFKQKAQLRSNDTKDPPLGPGWGTFVENKAYLGYVSQFVDQDEVCLSQ